MSAAAQASTVERPCIDCGAAHTRYPQSSVCECCADLRAQATADRQRWSARKVEADALLKLRLSGKAARVSVCGLCPEISVSLVEPMRIGDERCVAFESSTTCAKCAARMDYDAAIWEVPL